MIKIHTKHCLLLTAVITNICYLLLRKYHASNSTDETDITERGVVLYSTAWSSSCYLPLSHFHAGVAFHALKRDHRCQTVNKLSEKYQHFILVWMTTHTHMHWCSDLRSFKSINITVFWERGLYQSHIPPHPWLLMKHFLHLLTSYQLCSPFLSYWLWKYRPHAAADEWKQESQTLFSAIKE